MSPLYNVQNDCLVHQEVLTKRPARNNKVVEGLVVRFIFQRVEKARPRAYFLGVTAEAVTTLCSGGRQGRAAPGG